MKQHENHHKIKDQISKIKDTVQKSKIIKFLIIFFAILFLVYNLTTSQTISPIYYQMTTNNKNAVIFFLEKIKTFPEFIKIMEMNKNIYGDTVEKEIFRQENEKKELINNLEQQLSINPRARDILYSLYKLYLQEGNNLQAQKYLEQVKSIDPGFKLNIKN